MAVHARSAHFSRRAVLRGGALTIAFALSDHRTELFAQGASRAPRILDPNLVDAFLAVNGDGTVTIFCGKVDLGQGLRIAIRQMAAEELGITIDKVGYVEGDTALTPNQGRTSGSSGIQRGGVQIRQTAATARKALIELAARRLGAKPNDLIALDGQVRPKAGGAGIRFADLIGERRFDLKVDSQAPLKDPASYSIVGKPLPRPDVPAKCTGSHIYVHDFTMRGMLHARVIRPPAIGAKLVSVDESSIENLGAKVVRIKDFLAVVAAAARTAVRADGGTIWTASQGTHGTRATFARFLGLRPEKVRLIYLDGSGCYGMNGHEDAAADAAIVSRAVGQPVRLQRSREDEHGWDPKGPPQLLEISGAVNDGRILDWRTEMWLPQATRGLPNIPLLGPEAAGLDQVRGLNAGLISQNGDPPYAADHVEVLVHWLKTAPLRPAPLRSPGKPANVFAVESFVDELAAAERMDPVEFRLRGLGDPRGIEVIERIARLMQWQSRPSPGPDQNAPVAHGRGMAYVHYKHDETYVAMGMEVAVERASGKIKVERVACAFTPFPGETAHSV